MSAKELIKSLEERHSDLETRSPEQNSDLQQLLRDWGLADDELRRSELVMTEYHPVEKLTNGLAIKW